MSVDHEHEIILAKLAKFVKRRVWAYNRKMETARRKDSGRAVWYVGLAGLALAGGLGLAMFSGEAPQARCDELLEREVWKVGVIDYFCVSHGLTVERSAKIGAWVEVGDWSTFGARIGKVEIMGDDLKMQQRIDRKLSVGDGLLEVRTQRRESWSRWDPHEVYSRITVTTLGVTVVDGVWGDGR